MVQKLKFSKNDNNKRPSSKLIFFNEKKSERFERFLILIFAAYYNFQCTVAEAILKKFRWHTKKISGDNIKIILQGTH